LSISDRGVAVAVGNMNASNPDVAPILIDNGINEHNFSAYSNSMILLRNAILTEPFFLDDSMRSHLTYDPGTVLQEQGFNLVANNGAVRCYVK
jgi:hypothetical protein